MKQESISEYVIDWNNIHDKCNLNEIRDRLFLTSRWFSKRFESIIFLFEEGYYFEGLFNLLTLLENVLRERFKKEGKFIDIINDCIKDLYTKAFLHELRKLRNCMAHGMLIEYYVIFDENQNRIEYPLNEAANYVHIINKILTHCIELIDETKENVVSRTYPIFRVLRYEFFEITSQYGLSEVDVQKIMIYFDVNNIDKMEIRSIILQLLDNSTPAVLLERILGRM